MQDCQNDEEWMKPPHETKSNGDEDNEQITKLEKQVSKLFSSNSNSNNNKNKKTRGSDW